VLVILFTLPLRADLHGTIFAYNGLMTSVVHATRVKQIVYNSSF